MKIAILGFGEEGRSLSKYLRKNPKYKKAEIWILDKNPSLKLPRGTKTVLGSGYLADLERFEVIFRSPGIPYHIQPLEKVRRAKKTVTSVTKVFFEEAKKKGVKIVGVTGSKGKTTTATLIYLMLQAAKFNVALAGNVGKSPLDLLPRLRRGNWVVLELSSFQLQDLTFSPPIAVILDIFPEHLDAHRSLAEYYAAKGNICRHQSPGEKTFYLSHNPITRWLADSCPGQKIEVADKSPAPFGPQDLKLRGTHAYRNALIAAKVAESLGVKPETIRQVIRRFPGIEHRLELVRTLTKKGEHIHFYNDSASTNPNTAAAAVLAFRDVPHVLIAGGHDKRLDYRPLAEALRKTPATKLVILAGDNQEKIAQAIRDTKVPLLTVKNLKEATVRAASFLKKIPGEEKAVLFSPGAASFDAFQNYKYRGEEFRALVRKL